MNATPQPPSPPPPAPMPPPPGQYAQPQYGQPQYAPPPQYVPGAPYMPVYAAAPQPKSRAVAAGLAIILGGLGIHKFYMGKVAQGVLYLIFVWTYIPSFIGWIEGILYLAKSDEAWAAEHGWPLERSNGAAIAILWVVALLPLLSIVAIVALIFLGGQVSMILSNVGHSV